MNNFSRTIFSISDFYKNKNEFFNLKYHIMNVFNLNKTIESIVEPTNLFYRENSVVPNSKGIM